MRYFHAVCLFYYLFNICHNRFVNRDYLLIIPTTKHFFTVGHNKMLQVEIVLAFMKLESLVGKMVNLSLGKSRSWKGLRKKAWGWKVSNEIGKMGTAVQLQRVVSNLKQYFPTWIFSSFPSTLSDYMQPIITIFSRF